MSYRNLKGILILLLSSLLFAAMNVVIKYHCYEDSRASLIFSRGLVGLSLLTIYFAFKPVAFPPAPLNKLLFLRSVFASLSVAALYLNLSLTSAANATFLQNLSFIFVFLFTFHIRSQGKTTIGVLLAGVSILFGLIGLINPAFSSLNLAILTVGLLSALFSSLSIISLKRMSASLQAPVITAGFAIGNIITGLVLLPIEGNASAWSWVGVGAGGIALVAQLVLTYGVRFVPSSVVVPISFSIVLFSFLLESTIYMGASTKVGMGYSILILLGIGILLLVNRSAAAESSS